MPSYTVYERQTKTVAHEVEADSEIEATLIVHNKDLSDYTYVVEEDYSIENVELTDNEE